MYTEDKNKSSSFRADYLNSIYKLIEQQQQIADLDRSRFISPELLALNPDKYRRDLIHMLGWPLTETCPADLPAVREIPVAVTAAATITRLQIEVLKDFWYYGLLIVPHQADVACQTERKLPLIICQHGGYGTPELCSDIHGSNNYGGVVWRLIARGAAVFAPQMLLWRESPEDEDHFPGYGLPYNRGKIDAQLKQLGSSITALEVFCLSRSLDRLIAHPLIEREQIGMIGLSYGGFYTLMASAVDTRIRAGYASAFFNNRYRYCSPDWSWDDSARCFLDAEIAALVAPRALYIEVGTKDHVFDIESALPEYARLQPFYAAQHVQEKLRLSVIEQDHRFDVSDAGLDFIFNQVRMK